MNKSATDKHKIMIPVKQTKAVLCDMVQVRPLFHKFSGSELKLYLWFVTSTENGKYACQDTLLVLTRGTGMTVQTVSITLKSLIAEKYISRKAQSARKPVIKLLKPLK